MKALVTGDLGFIGRRVSRALGDAGYLVTGIDLAAGADARDFFLHGDGLFDVVVHCAAVVGGRALIDGAPLALASNLELDAGLFQWALRNRPRRVVYFSSSAAYPVALQDAACRHHLRETDISPGHPMLPDALYGWAKLTGEMLAARAVAEGLNVSVCRPFSGYGADQGENYPFPAITGRARRREDPFTVWGPGTQVRDFIHVDDVIAAVMVMIGEGVAGPVNLGTGRPISMTGLAQMACTAAGYTPQIVPRPDAPSGVSYRVADVTQMSEFFTPEITLEEGVARALGAG